MTECAYIVDEIIRDLCGSELYKGYGFDEWSEVIKKLKLLETRLRETKDAPTVPQQPLCASPKPCARWKSGCICTIINGAVFCSDKHCLITRTAS